MGKWLDPGTGFKINYSASVMIPKISHPKKAITKAKSAFVEVPSIAEAEDEEIDEFAKEIEDLAMERHKPSLDERYFDSGAATVDAAD